MVDQNLTIILCAQNSVLITSPPTPLAEMSPQTMTEPLTCFTGGFKDSLLCLSLDLQTMI